jgi:hypothetical protein
MCWCKFCFDFDFSGKILRPASLRTAVRYALVQVATDKTVSRPFTKRQAGLRNAPTHVFPGTPASCAAFGIISMVILVKMLRMK